MFATPPTLILIDFQQAIDHPSWARYGPRNMPGAERNAARMLASWRARRLPLYHVRHDSLEPQSTYRPGQPGHAFKPEVTPLPGEPVIAKHTGSAFLGTSLEHDLRSLGLRTLVIAGVITNNSVETTVRAAGCLGFETWLAEDACFTFARPDFTGLLRTAAEVHAMSLANLHGEYSTVTTIATVLRAVDSYCAAFPRQNARSTDANSSDT